MNHTGITRALPNTKVSFIAAEYGTRDIDTVLGSIRADNWLHQHGDLDSDQGRQIKAELREVFRPDDRGWEARILEIGARVVQEACAGLAGGGYSPPSS